jgi:Flp pilus assembly protein TadG
VLKRVVANARGNVALTVALCAPVLLGAVGFAVDYAYASYINHGLQDAADAAVLAASSQDAATSGGGYADISWLRNYGVDVFNGNITNLPVTGVTPTVTVVSNGSGGVVATASYTYSVPTFMSSIIGISTIPVSGSATATGAPVIHINYYILVDISQSMGVGATQSDMTTLYNRVVAYNNGSQGETGCVFGCHVAQPGQTYTNEYLAHSISPAVTLRIDAAVSAIKNIINLAAQNAGTTQNIKVGLYTMSENPVSGTLVTTVASPSSNYSSLLTSAGTIGLGNNTSAGYGDTDFTDQLSTFNSMVGSNGTGATSASPINYVFIITDGLSDVPNGSWIGHATAAFDPSLCSTLKTKATVGVIYTTYLPIYNQNNSGAGYESNYATLVAPYVSQIPGNLQSCATSAAYYYQASDGPAITTGMQTLFASSLQATRLTN